MAAFEAGQIVIADWRDGLPKEANKLRPAVVVEDTALFGSAYPNVILVPLTEDGSMVMPELSVRIDPTPENGCTKTCFAVSPLVAGTAKLRVRATASRITAEQLARIRRQVAEAIGLG
jgi:mRNA-degrading endonuclease toxin of MazEF toxin-antitoxin module